MLSDSIEEKVSLEFLRALTTPEEAMENGIQEIELGFSHTVFLKDSSESIVDALQASIEV